MTDCEDYRTAAGVIAAYIGHYRAGRETGPRLPPPDAIGSFFDLRIAEFRPSGGSAPPALWVTRFSAEIDFGLLAKKTLLRPNLSQTHDPVSPGHALTASPERMQRPSFPRQVIAADVEARRAARKSRLRDRHRRSPDGCSICDIRPRCCPGGMPLLGGRGCVTFRFASSARFLDEGVRISASTARTVPAHVRNPWR